MAGFFDYLAWRGDLSFSEIAPNEIDAAILSMIVYIDFDKLSYKGKTLSECAEGYIMDDEFGSVKLGLIVPSKNINKLFCLSSKSRRFSPIEICDYVAYTNERENCQFAAATFLLPGKRAFVVFRGTDDTIVGWHEDFCLSFSEQIPAQKKALEYLEAAAQKYPERKIYVAGHSKGGNLALYSTTYCSEETREKLAKIYCFDGPGLSRKMVASEGFKLLQRKRNIYIPQSSYIGIMFERGKKYKVVESRGRGPYQHDCFYWEVQGPRFVRLNELSSKGKRNEEQFRTGMDSMTLEEKREFVDTFFSIVAFTGAKTLSDFSDGGVKKLIVLIKTYSGLDKKKKDLMLALILKLFDFKKEKEA